ncbi:hypothetical protein NPIL_114251, partial [Nephila pilipes]
ETGEEPTATLERKGDGDGKDGIKVTEVEIGGENIDGRGASGGGQWWRPVPWDYSKFYSKEERAPDMGWCKVPPVRPPIEQDDSTS